ncbi:hypothetical protein PFISCL1PPCAC_2171, partial [Pristionchus fissidentatus]
LIQNPNVPSLKNCAACKEKVTHVDASRGNAFYTLGRVWHKAHLSCVRCHLNVSEIEFRESKMTPGKPVCVDCFMMETNPKCSGCTQTMFETGWLACGRYFHKECLTCHACSNVCPDGKYMVDNFGRLYHPDCYHVRVLAHRYNVQFSSRMHAPKESDK